MSVTTLNTLNLHNIVYQPYLINFFLIWVIKLKKKKPCSSAHCSVDQELRVVRFSAHGIARLDLRCWPDWILIWMIREIVYLQAHSFYWQTPIHHNCVTEIYVSIMSVGNHSRLLETTCLPSHVALSIFKPAIMQLVLLILWISSSFSATSLR